MFSSTNNFLIFYFLGSHTWLNEVYFNIDRTPNKRLNYSKKLLRLSLPISSLYFINHNIVIPPYKIYLVSGYTLS